MDRQSLVCTSAPDVAMIALLIVTLLLTNGWGHASTGSGTSAGALLGGMANDTGVREWIELSPSGDVLIGRPTRSSVALLSVYAPGSMGGQVILRELQLSDGRNTLLLTAPPQLVNHIRRVTIYIKHSSTDLVLFESVGERWERREPQTIHATVGEAENSSQEDFFVFSVKRLGFFWLLNRETMASDSLPFLPTPEARHLLGGSIRRAVLPWAWSLVLLVVSWVASWWIHNYERQGET